MLLRSSSTPILESVFSPTKNLHVFDKNSSPCSDNMRRSPFTQSGQLSFGSFCNSPMAISCSVLAFPDSNRESILSGFRRSQSAGNLGECKRSNVIERRYPSLPRIPKPTGSILQTIPSLFVFNLRDIEKEEEIGDCMERTPTMGGHVTREFGFSQGKFLGFSEEVDLRDGEHSKFFGETTQFPPLFISRGLGIDRHDTDVSLTGVEDNAVEHYVCLQGTCENDDHSDVEEYYKKMVDEHPCNALVLKNYAHFLYQLKSDLRRAEEYYSRAILVEPGSGETLAQYAKLIWELHHDHERALSYFEQAIQSSPTNSHVQAAYARFLWETEVDEDGDDQEARCHDFALDRFRSFASAPA